MSLHAGFAFLDDAVPGVRWEAKYATCDNFTGRPVDGYEVDRVVVSHAVAAGLSVAAERAAELGFGLLVWDGYRPLRAVERFVAWATEPEDGHTKARFHPHLDRAEMFALGYVALRSGHTRGAAVDLALVDPATGEAIDLGGRHDLMDERSHHGAAGVSDTAAERRRTLCSVMESSGFVRYEAEWWHYALVDEPYPDTYFDFPIR
jgi:D-alanyl-D-alanine dipeptidase